MHFGYENPHLTELFLDKNGEMCKLNRCRAQIEGILFFIYFLKLAIYIRKFKTCGWISCGSHVFLVHGDFKPSLFMHLQIGNCVGANNQGYFILFLIFTTLSCLYVLGMSIYTYNHSRMSSTIDFPEPGTSGIELDYLADVFSSLLFGNQVTFTIRYIGLLYLFVISMALLIGVGILLYQQLSLLYQGQTYLDSLSTAVSESNSGSRRKGWVNLQRVFGNRYPWLWLLPYISSKKFHTR